MKVELREVCCRIFTGIDLETVLLVPDKALRELVDLRRTYRLQVNRYGLHTKPVDEARKNLYFFVGGVSSGLEIKFTTIWELTSRLEVHELSENRRVMPKL